MKPSVPAVLLVGLGARVAAADTHPLSEIRTTAQLGSADGSEDTWSCAVLEAPADWLRGNDLFPHGEPLVVRNLTTEQVRGRERLVVTARGAELQRAQGSGRSRIPLVVVGHAAGAGDVFAYWSPTLDDGAPSLFLVVAAPSGTGAYDSDAGGGGVRTGGSFDCGIVQTALHVVHGNSRVGQIEAVAASGKRVTISASVTKTSRDPEPLLTVSVIAQQVLFAPK